MDAFNLPQMHRLQSERFASKTAVRYKQAGSYRALSWTDYRRAVEAVASGLIERGVEPGDAVAILSENRWEWLVADLAILTAGAITVPLHAALSSSQIQFQLADAEVRWIFVSTASQAAKLEAVRSSLPLLEGILCFEDGTFGSQSSSHEAELRKREEGIGRDDLATIMYTSGTTGNPKGVMLSHGNFLSNARSFAEMGRMSSEGTTLNWLPLSHIYARTVDHYVPLTSGGTLALADSQETLVQNLAEIHPTHLSSVPRFYEKLLANLAGVPDRDERLRAIFGPRIDWLGCGGAPLPPSIAQAYQQAGLLVLQGYGLTESSPVISFNRKERFKLESVGQALPDVEIRIADDGEVLTRGPHVMKGYWKLPDATAQALEGGWLHTGDLGALDADGFLAITGRKKDLLVLSSGKKVVPTWIEGLLVSDPAIDQAVVCGEGKNFLAALVVPNWAHVGTALGEASPPQVESYLMERIQIVLKDASPWERVKRLVVVAEPFSIAREEVTPSLKLRRSVILDHFRSEIEALYGS